MTYADKYALMKAYKISTGDDPVQEEPKSEKVDADQNQKKAEQVAVTIIDDKKFETIQGELDRTGVKALQICKQYQVSSLKELNIQHLIKILKEKQEKITKE